MIVTTLTMLSSQHRRYLLNLRFCIDHDCFRVHNDESVCYTYERWHGALSRISVLTYPSTGPATDSQLQNTHERTPRPKTPCPFSLSFTREPSTFQPHRGISQLPAGLPTPSQTSTVFWRFQWWYWHPLCFFSLFFQTRERVEEISMSASGRLMLLATPYGVL